MDGFHGNSMNSASLGGESLAIVHGMPRSCMCPYPFVQTAEIMASECYITHYSKTYSEFGLAQSKLWNEGYTLHHNCG